MEYQKEELKQAIRDVLEEIDLEEKLLYLEVSLDEMPKEPHIDTSFIENWLKIIEERLDSIESDIKEIKESDIFERAEDKKVIMRNNIAEINAGIREILNRI